MTKQATNPVVFPAAELQSAIEDLLSTICGYEGLDVEPPESLAEAQTMAAIAIQKLQDSSLVSEAMTQVKLRGYTQSELNEALADVGL